MTLLQINATDGFGSTGLIARGIENCARQAGMDTYMAYMFSNRHDERNLKVGHTLDHKIHALLSRLTGKQSYFSRCATKKLLKYIDTVHPDVVHLHNMHNNYCHLNMVLKHLASRHIKTVLTLHDCWFYTGGCFHYVNYNCRQWVTGCQHCPQKASLFFDSCHTVFNDRKRYFENIEDLTVVGVSNWIAGEAQKGLFKNKKVCCIHNGVDVSFFQPTESDFRQRYHLEGQYVIAALSSKLMEPKNAECLNRLLDYAKDNPQVSILLFGGRLNGKNLPENVRDLGFIRSREELRNLFSSSDLFVNVSLQDSLSLISLEAQACGLPVVVYNNTGLPETVCPDYGYIVETGDIEHLFSAISDARQKGKSYFAPHCRRWVEENFDQQKNYQQYIDLYQNL